MLAGEAPMNSTEKIFLEELSEDPLIGAIWVMIIRLMRAARYYAEH
jgi:hypothetical protein